MRDEAREALILDIVRRLVPTARNVARDALDDWLKELLEADASKAALISAVMREVREEVRSVARELLTRERIPS
jgi:phosphate uptake regulator